MIKIYSVIVLFSLLYINLTAQETGDYQANHILLKQQLNNFLTSARTETLIQSIIKSYQVNEEDNNKIYYFPLFEDDFDLQWKFKSALFKECEKNYKLITFYLDLDNIKWRNVEFGEELSFSFYEVAINSPINFLKSFSELSDDKKEKLLNNLSMINELNMVDEFINNISKINNKNLLSSKERIVEYFK